MLMKTALPFLIANCLTGAVASSAFAAGDMLTPDEVQTTGISTKPTNDSGVFLGGKVLFGQGRSTEDGSTGGMAYFLGVEPGYQASRGSWGRFEVSADLFTGLINFRNPNSTAEKAMPGKITAQLPFGLMIKGGYGYSLGGDVFGVLKLGAGPVLGKVKLEAPDSHGTFTSDSISGLAWQIGWELVAPINKTVDFTGGLSWTQVQLDVTKLKNGGTSVAVDRNLIANVPGVDLGLRVRF